MLEVEMKILIAGCGYVGRAVGKYFASKGDEVWGLSRSPQGLETLGVKPISADLLKAETLSGLPTVDVVILSQAPSRASDDYHKTYVEGARNLTKVLAGKAPRKLILISSTRGYGQSHGEALWVDESTEPEPADENAKSLLEAESVVLKSRIPSVVFRLGGIYGIGRNRLRQIRSGKAKPEFADVYVNRIHVDDIVRAIEILAEKGKPGEVYLGVDDWPSTQREFYTWIYDRLSIKKPALSAPGSDKKHGVSNKRCSNKKLKSLGLNFKHPSFREGYEAIIKEEI